MLKTLLVLMLLPPAARADEPQGDWDARLSAVSGEVRIFVSGGDAEGVAAEKDMPLDVGDRLLTGDGGSAEISFEGGSVMSLQENSDFTLEDIRKKDSTLSLAFGRLLAKIGALGGGGLRVRTPTAVAAVRGTEFGVEVPAENPDETTVGVFDEGKVEVQGLTSGGESLLLIANQETQVVKGRAPATAYQLKRFMRQRERMRDMRRRLPYLRKTWRALGPSQRRELRQAAFQRIRGQRRDQKRPRRGQKEIRRRRGR